MIIAETPLTIRYAETDRMGIVHHSNYPIWFEVGRMDFFQKVGASYTGIEAEGILLPLIQLGCNFKQAIRYGETVLIKTHLTKISSVKCEFSYEIHLQGGNKLLSTGTTVHAWTDKNLKPVILAKALPGVYELLQQAL
ncbi:MAG: acyl-CoA thioesterase [Firmicutes bacterium]|nr:acyl-CoA thioesterase [Bacillota bacterium]